MTRFRTIREIVMERFSSEDVAGFANSMCEFLRESYGALDRTEGIVSRKVTDFERAVFNVMVLGRYVDKLSSPSDEILVYRNTMKGNDYYEEFLPFDETFS